MYSDLYSLEQFYKYKIDWTDDKIESMTHVSFKPKCSLYYFKVTTDRAYNV